MVYSSAERLVLRHVRMYSDVVSSRFGSTTAVGDFSRRLCSAYPRRALRKLRRAGCNGMPGWLIGGLRTYCRTSKCDGAQDWHTQFEGTTNRRQENNVMRLRLGVLARA